MSKKKKKDKVEEVPQEKSKAPKKSAVKAATIKPKKAAPAKAVKPAVAITNDAIALRAYFIAERRQQEGIHGDEHGDWVEAERQLRKEAGR